MRRKIGERVVEDFETFCDTCGNPSIYNCETCGADVCDDADCLGHVKSDRIDGRDRQVCAACPASMIALGKVYDSILNRHRRELEPVLSQLHDRKEELAEERQNNHLLPMWCVRHKDGWCAANARKRKPNPAAFKIKTRCAHYVTLPLGVEQRLPTCKECLRALSEEQCAERG